MILEEFILKFSLFTVKEKTAAFNSLTVNDRLYFLELLPEKNYKKFIKDIRQQAVQDFWDNERELILEGKCTRDWTPEQI